MKRILILSLLILFGQPLKVQAQNTEDALCSAYSKGGKVIVEMLQPLSFEQAINLFNEQNSEVIQQIAIKLLENMTVTEVNAMMQLNEQDSGLLFGMAGTQSVTLWLQKPTASSEEIQQQLYQQCITEGSQVLIERMRQANTRLEI